MIGTHADIARMPAAAAEFAAPRRGARPKLWHESRDLLMRVIDSVPARVFWKDKDLRYLGCNAAFARDAGVDQSEQVVGRDPNWAGPPGRAYGADDRAVMRTGQAKIAVPGAADHARWAAPCGCARPRCRCAARKARSLVCWASMRTSRNASAVDEQLRKLSLAVEQSSESIVITDLLAHRLRQRSLRAIQRLQPRRGAWAQPPPAAVGPHAPARPTCRCGKR
jgi:hypothetical protein